MLKKSLFVLASGCALSVLSSPSVHAMPGGNPYDDSSQFDPESSEVSKKATIKTWVAPQHYRHLNTIQPDVAMTVSENPFAVNLALPIVNAPGVTQYFGKNFPTMPFELKFLRYVREISKTTKPITLEPGAGIGLVSWKVPLAFGKQGGTHYVNDINFAGEMGSTYEMLMDYRLGAMPSLKEKLVKLPGSCFDIPNTHPHLVGKVNAIYVQNLDHFFDPETHQRYLGLLKDLLAPGGRAFVVAHSFLFKEGDSLFKLYQQQKKAGDPYPGFVQYDVKFKQIVGNEFQVGDWELSNAVRPANNAAFETIEVTPPKALPSIFHPQMGILQRKERHQRVTTNAFSPGVYKGLLEKMPEVKLIDTFFIANDGKRAEKWGESIRHAAVIFEKK